MRTFSSAAAAALAGDAFDDEGFVGDAFLVVLFGSFLVTLVVGAIFSGSTSQ